ncbi:hypothetical protein Y048_6311 [Burkholderia pseudomallei MSHR456]|nr:hypothetical protein Y048_6311 [Burkholderia pseudomallei MSHR456]
MHHAVIEQAGEPEPLQCGNDACGVLSRLIVVADDAEQGLLVQHGRGAVSPDDGLKGQVRKIRAQALAKGDRGVHVAHVLISPARGVLRGRDRPELVGGLARAVRSLTGFGVDRVDVDHRQRMHAAMGNGRAREREQAGFGHGPLRGARRRIAGGQGDDKAVIADGGENHAGAAPAIGAPPQLAHRLDAEPLPVGGAEMRMILQFDHDPDLRIRPRAFRIRR